MKKTILMSALVVAASSAVFAQQTDSTNSVQGQPSQNQSMKQRPDEGSNQYRTTEGTQSQQPQINNRDTTGVNNTYDQYRLQGTQGEGIHPYDSTRTQYDSASFQGTGSTTPSGTGTSGVQDGTGATGTQYNNGTVQPATGSSGNGTFKSKRRKTGPDGGQ
jgi:hypothetical protein